MFDILKNLKKEYIVGVLILVVIILSGMYLLFDSSSSKSTMSPGIRSGMEKMVEKKLTNSIDPLEKCGWEVYLTKTCPYCVKQLKVLKEHFPNFNGYYYNKKSDVVPTWYNKSTNIKSPGFKDYKKLLSMINC